MQSAGGDMIDFCQVTVRDPPALLLLGAQAMPRRLDQEQGDAKYPGLFGPKMPPRPFCAVNYPVD